MHNRSTAAREFAIAAHGDQKYGTHPYSVHLDAVADNAAAYGEEAQIIAYLHDVVEDTTVPLDTIREQFGERIATCVSLLTDEPGTNRKERKVRTNAKLKVTPDEFSIALVVKAADRLANLRAGAKESNSPKLQMYRHEHPAFREAVFRPGLCDELWTEIDRIVDAGES